MFRSELLDVEEPTFRACTDAAYGMLERAVRGCVAEGYAAESDVKLLVASAWSIAHGLAGLIISGRLAERLGVVDREAISKLVIDRFVGGVVDRAPTAS